MGRAADYILDLVNVTVGDGEAVDMGILPLTGWWTNSTATSSTTPTATASRTPGEPGIADYTLTMRKRENSLMDRGATAVTTDATGYYVMENAYPMTQWLVMEAYDDLFYTTGVTYQADNQPDRRRRSSAPASTSACCPSSACPAGSTGACTPTTPTGTRTASTRATAASSARSATTPPATSSTRATPRSRTGSRASPA